MKLSAEVFREIISIVQEGMLGQTDVSEKLRALDLIEGKDGKLYTVDTLDGLPETD